MGCGVFRRPSTRHTRWLSLAIIIRDLTPHFPLCAGKSPDTSRHAYGAGPGSGSLRGALPMVPSTHDTSQTDGSTPTGAQVELQPSPFAAAQAPGSNRGVGVDGSNHGAGNGINVAASLGPRKGSLASVGSASSIPYSQTGVRL